MFQRRLDSSGVRDWMAHLYFVRSARRIGRAGRAFELDPRFAHSGDRQAEE